MKKLLALPLFLLLAGCPSIAKEYVSADRATYNAIAPEYRKYIEADETLSESELNLRLGDLDSWDYRLRQAEEAGDE